MEKKHIWIGVVIALVVVGVFVFPHIRWLQFRRWVTGHAPNYRPTLADLQALAEHAGERDQIVLVGGGIIKA